MKYILFCCTFQVLQLMSLTDSRLPQIGCEKLELSMMSFLGMRFVTIEMTNLYIYFIDFGIFRSYSKNLYNRANAKDENL